MLQTKHLRLRRWESHDVGPFAALCNDPEVVRFFNGWKSVIDCAAEIERQEICFDTYKYGIWAVELKATGEFIGAAGIEPTMMPPKGMTARLTWKLRPEFWGMNYGYEAVAKVIDYAFSELKVSRVFALVVPANTRSLRLVKRLGLKQNHQMENSYFKYKK